MNKRKMKTANQRMLSFIGWSGKVPAQALVAAGFYFTGTGDECQCWACGVKIQKWRPGITVAAIHRVKSPTCDIVQGKVSPNGEQTRTGQSNDVLPNGTSRGQAGESATNRTGTHYTDTHTSAVPDGGPRTNNVSNGIGQSFQGVGFDHLDHSGLPMTLPGNTVPNGLPTELDGRYAFGSEPPPAAPSPASPSPATQPSTSRRKDYSSVEARLATFTKWPKAQIVIPQSLADAGFFYFNEGDRVQCAFCLGRLHGWVEGDDPVVEHRKHLPSCNFIRRLAEYQPAQNLAVTSSYRSQTEPLLWSSQFDSTATAESNRRHTEPLTFPRGTSFVPFSELTQSGRGARVTSHSGSAATGVFVSQAATNLDQSSLGQLGIVTAKPKAPHMAIEVVRLETYKEGSAWPVHSSQKPEVLAKAGFYYTGRTDNVRCFFCDGGLQDWTEEDEPWREHARWFPKCGFVKQCMGEDYIQSIPRGQDAYAREAAVAAANGLTTPKPPAPRPAVPQNTLMGNQQPEILPDIQPHPQQQPQPQPQPRPQAQAQAQAQQNPVRNVREADVLQTPAATYLKKDMGYSNDIIQEAYNILAQAGNVTPQAQELLQVIFDIEERRTQEPEARQEPRQEPVEAAGGSRPAGAEKTFVAAGADSHVAKSQAGCRQKIIPANRIDGHRHTESTATAPVEVAQGGSQAVSAAQSGNPRLGLRGGSSDYLKGMAQQEAMEEEEEEEPMEVVEDDPELHKLRTENVQLKNSVKCMKCNKKQVDTLFLPCGHLVVCGDCFPGTKNCIKCKALIVGIVKTFMC